MRQTKLLLASILLGIVGSGSALGQAHVAPARDPEKDKTIRVLLEVMGTQKLMQQMMSQMLDGFRSASPDVPAEFWDRFSKKMDTAALIDLLIPVYDRYYSKEDLDDLIGFYRSALGQKLLTTLPNVMRESMAIGQEWGKKKGEEVQHEIEKQRAQKKPAKR